MNDGDRCCCHSDLRCQGCVIHGLEGQRHGNEQHPWPNVWTDRDSRERRVDFRAAMAANVGSHWPKWESEVADLQPLVGLFTTERNGR